MQKLRGNERLSSGHSALPRWKKLAYGLLTTVLILVALEVVLAICGVQPLTATEDPYAGFTAILPHFEERAEIGEPPKMRTARNKLAYLNEQSFAVDKPTDTYRIFCLGGSTTHGQPYDDPTSFVGWLRTLLHVAYPDREWEVVNAGGISYASYRVAALMEELVEYEPDLFIIYTGHNEFLEERTYRAVRSTPGPLRRLTLAAAGTRTGAAFSLLFSPPGPADPAVELPPDVETILDRSVGPAAYERNEVLRRQIVAHYEASLRRMLDLAQSSGADVLLVRPACNLRDCAPFRSEPSDMLTGKRLQQWQQRLETGRRLQAAGHHQRAVEALTGAASIDDRAAELHYLLGQALFALAEFDAAEAAFTRAVDEDICPLRMTSDLAAVFDRVVAEERVPRVDFHALLRHDLLRDRGHPVLGREHFLDHVHPTIDAHGRLAEALIERLREEGILPGTGPLAQPVIEAARVRIESRVDPVDHARAEAELARVLFWAGKYDQAGALALKALPYDADDPRTWLIAGIHLHNTGKPEAALKHLEQAERMSPNDPRIQQALRAIGQGVGESNEGLKE